MGIFIHLAISHSVTKKEWEEVYKESLELIKHFPLAEKREVEIRGIDTICLVPTEEREHTYGWNDEKVEAAWDAVGDYNQMRFAEDYYTPKDLVGDVTDPDAGDAMFSALPAYGGYDWKEDRFNHSYELWGAKTQGEPYHMYLLAIGCMIEDRLKEKAFVYGDITKGQCVKAVEMANKYLDRKISVPARCDIDRLYNRISEFPLPESEKLAVMNRFYLGVQDEEYGAFIRRQFTDCAHQEYWKKRIERTTVGTIGFDDILREYLMWGFELGEMCDYVEYLDSDGNDLHEKFILRILDTKLYIEEKDCRDPLQIDQEESVPYSIWTLLGQFAFAGARNRNVNRFIPIGEIRETLNSKFPDINVNEIIDNYLEEEKKEILKEQGIGDMSDEEAEKYIKKNASSLLSKSLDAYKERVEKVYEKYDIADYDSLLFYEKGDAVHPNIMKSLAKSYLFYIGTTNEPHFTKLMEKSPLERCRWLVEQNRNVLIRDKDWEKIFEDIEENEESYTRYYPMVRVKFTSEAVAEMVKAFVINDELFEYCKELSETLDLEEDEEPDD